MLTQEQEATNYYTMRHIERVRNLLNTVIIEILRRAEKHDQTKMDTPEVEAFTAKTKELAACTFGSEEYNKNKRDIQQALDHHYAHNRHHPEHFKSGVDDMNLIDIIEMLVDWKASSERHHDGNLRKSIDINTDRFNISPQLRRIMENTIEVFDR